MYKTLSLLVQSQGQVGTIPWAHFPWLLASANPAHPLQWVWIGLQTQASTSTGALITVFQESPEQGYLPVSGLSANTVESDWRKTWLVQRDSRVQGNTSGPQGWHFKLHLPWQACLSHSGCAVT